MRTTQQGALDWRRYEPLALGPVLSAAADAFVQVGYHGATVRDIARRCGLSVPGIYHHYLTKQDMLVRLLDLLMEDLLQRSQTAVSEGGDNPVRRFGLLVENLALTHTYRRDLAFIGASEMRSLEPANRKRIIAMRREQQRMVDAEVEAGVAAGRFRTSVPHEASRAVVAMCTGIVQWYRDDKQFIPEEIAGQYVDFALSVVSATRSARGAIGSQRGRAGLTRT